MKERIRVKNMTTYDLENLQESGRSPQDGGVQREAHPALERGGKGK